LLLKFAYCQFFKFLASPPFILKYDHHQTSAEYVLNNRSLWGDPYNCFQVIQDTRVGKRQFACPPVGIVVVSLTGGHDKAVLTAHDGSPAGVELEKIECTAFRSS
jgi:hypothetical protein